MRVVKQFFPPVESLLQMDPEGAAYHLLDCLCVLEDNERWTDGETSFTGWQLLNRAQFIQPSNYQDYAAPDYHEAVGVALSEAWSWLERHGLLVPKPEYQGYSTVTKTGRRLRGNGDPRVLFAIGMLPPGQLDGGLEARVRPAFLKGDYPDAVFQAFKRVEVVVHELARLGADCYGKDVMRSAFAPENGPLANLRQPYGEREGLSHLFAGALQAFKNPGSHGDPDFDDPIAVAELILLADLLIRIAKRHSEVATAHQEGS